MVKFYEGYVMKIGISGTQSVGKTTLLNSLRSEHIFRDYTICNEVTRWVKSLGFNINEQGNDKTQEIIMMKHLWNLHMNKHMITDRTVLDGYVYTKYLNLKSKVSSDTLSMAYEVFKALIGEYNYVFYIKPEFDLVSDGVRSDDNKFRDEIEELFVDTIKRENINVINISGSVTERTKQITSLIIGDMKW